MQVVYKGVGCIEAGRVPHSDYVCFEAMSKSITRMKFNGISKKLRGFVLYIICHKILKIVFKAVPRWYIRGSCASVRLCLF